MNIAKKKNLTLKYSIKCKLSEIYQIVNYE